jgi:glycine/D-amino acid oxidase-like deaminating enzyme
MLDRPFEPEAYAAPSGDGCFWRTTVADDRAYPPLTGDQTADFAIIGAGYAGLSAALELARAGASVAVLDMHAPGWGASGRNGGFCCLGGAKLTTAQLRQRYGEAEMRRFRAAERAAIALVDRLVRTHDMTVERHSFDGEAILAHRPEAARDFSAQAAEMAALHGVECRVLDRSELAAAGMAGPHFHGALITPLGFALNPLQYAIGLAHAAQDAGAAIHADAEATAIGVEGGLHAVRTAGGFLRARRLIVATNGYSSDNVPPWMRARFLPAQSSVIVTRPLTDDERAAQGWTSDLMAYDTRNLLHYFRLMPDRRFLFGMRGGLRATPAAQAAIRRLIRRDFEAMFPAWRTVETPWFWSGLVNLTRDLRPFVGRIGDAPDAWAAFGWHGNGVAMATWGGAQVARLALGRPTELPAFLQTPPRRFGLGRFRRAALAAAYAWYRFSDGGDVSS